MSLRFISCILLTFLALFSCCKKSDRKDYSQMYPPYRLINVFSEKLESDKKLILRGYGINFWLPKGYEYINGIGNFSVTYSLFKNKDDMISVEQARNLLVFVTENLLKEINSDPIVVPDLDVYPFSSNLIRLVIRFEDKNRIELGQDVAYVYFSKGKIAYEGYKISEYRDQYPAVGKHYTIHEESYEEALEIVKGQGNLTYLD